MKALMQFSEKPSELHAPDAIQLISVFAIIRACLKLHKQSSKKRVERVFWRWSLGWNKQVVEGGWGGTRCEQNKRKSWK